MTIGLAFGLREIPADVTSAWGARLIWPNDLVYDRQDLKGPESEQVREWLNDGPLKRVLSFLAVPARFGFSPGSDTTATLYDDGHGIIRGNPQASHGYLYVAAWLKP